MILRGFIVLVIVLVLVGFSSVNAWLVFGMNGLNMVASVFTLVVAFKILSDYDGT